MTHQLTDSPLQTKSGLTTKMELFTWPPSSGLASIHRDCLSILAYCRFLGVPVAVHESANPLGTPRGDLPVFRHNTTAASRPLAHFDEVVEHLKGCNFHADYALNPKQRSECVAFKKLLEEKWVPAAEFAFWDTC